MYLKRDFVLLNGFLCSIDAINTSDVVIKGKKYDYDEIEPIAIDDEKANELCITKRIPAALSIGLKGVNAEDISIEVLSVGRDFEKILNKNKSNSWSLYDIPESFLAEHQIKYIHELQHYIAAKTYFFSIEHKREHEMCF
jgi:hypothetical protein